MKTKLIITILLLLLLHPAVEAQSNVQAYFDTSQYYCVDSIFLKGHFKGQRMYIFFGNEDDESVIVHKKSDGKYAVYKNFLPCYSCQGRGSASPTYAGHIMKGNDLILIHDYFEGRDSVYLSLSGPVPTIKKIVRRSYDNEKIQGPDDAGNYVFNVKEDGTTHISKFELPLDRNDPRTKTLFFIKKIKWIKPNW